MNNKTRTAISILFFVLISFATSLKVVAQTGTLSGKVTGKNGAPLAKASVTVKGKNISAAANDEGVFELQNVPATGMLIISYVGYTTKEINYTAGKYLDVFLEEPTGETDEIIVTGVFDKRKKLESSVAITTLNAKEIARMAPVSSADLLKNIPGVYVNQARGEIWNTVYSRGISAGSIDNANGYYYVSLQEDGLPIININAGVDYFLRADATINRVEAVRGGTASILGANAPGGIFNYISKTGGTKFGGEIRAKFGLEGNGKNPYYRADADFGGPLSKDKTWAYNIGGFYRRSDGARDPGYPMNNGGQVKANITKTYKSGSFKLFAKFLDDRNALMEFIPTQGWTDPAIPSGFSKYDSYYLPDVTVEIPINTSGTQTFRSTDKIHSKEKAVGFNWSQNLGNGFTLKNDARYGSFDVSSNIPAVVTPFATDGLLFYAIPHLLGKFGTYTFTDQVRKQQLGTVTQLPNIINGQFAGFQFIPGPTNNFPGSNV
jgi:iron complex outermembrane receptor protein